MHPTNVVPVTILTGYLGSGKTTLLNHILQAEHQVRLAVIVNDFGKIDIDSKLIVESQEQTLSLANGCICCTIRGDLVDAVLGLLERTDRPDHILIEASGISDPAQIVLTFNRSVLRARTSIDSIITVVDGEYVLSDQGRTEKLLRDQVKVADLVILNKVDLLASDQIAKARQWILNISPDTRILETTFGNIPMETVLGVATYNPQTAFDTSHSRIRLHHVDDEGIHNHSDHSLVFGTWDWQTDQPLSITRVREVLDNLPDAIFRAKGVLYVEEVPERQIVLQMVGRRASLSEGAAWGDMARHTELVLIGNTTRVDGESLTRLFESAIVHQSASRGSRLEGVLRWLRRENKSK